MNTTSANYPPNVASAIARLRDGGRKVTKQRIALIELLAKTDHPASVDSLFEKLPEGICDLVTVYRMLEAFASIGLVQRTFLHNGTGLFMLKPQSPAYFAVSRSKGTFDEIDATLAADLAERIRCVEERLRARGYMDVTHTVQFYVD